MLDGSSRARIPQAGRGCDLTATGDPVAVNPTTVPTDAAWWSNSGMPTLLPGTDGYAYPPDDRTWLRPWDPRQPLYETQGGMGLLAATPMPERAAAERVSPTVAISGQQDL